MQLLSVVAGLQFFQTVAGYNPLPIGFHQFLLYIWKVLADNRKCAKLTVQKQFQSALYPRRVYETLGEAEDARGVACLQLSDFVTIAC